MQIFSHKKSKKVKKRPKYIKKIPMHKKWDKKIYEFIYLVNLSIVYINVTKQCIHDT